MHILIKFIGYFLGMNSVIYGIYSFDFVLNSFIIGGNFIIQLILFLFSTDLNFCKYT